MTGLQPVPFTKGRETQPRLSEPYVPGRRHPRFWSEEEIAVLGQHYPTGGAAACLSRLPGRSIDKVRAKANTLGLSAPKAHGGGRRSSIASPDDVDEQIRAAWPELAGRGAVQALAERLKVPRWWLTKRATRLGLTMPHRKEPPWTKAEYELLRRLPLHDLEKSAEIMREHGFARSPTAIGVKAKRQSVSRRFREALSARAAAKILGVDDKWVTARCIAGEIAATRRGTERLPQQGGDWWLIEPAELRRYVG